MDLGLNERVYIVTGGTSGLGFATAQALTGDGARVVISSRDPARCEQTASQLGQHMAEAIAADNADPGTAARLIAQARRAFGRLDGALISVGGPPPGTAMGSTVEQWRKAFESVFLGAVRLAVAIGAELTAGGSIALVLSTSVRSPIPSLAISNGLRPGLAGFAKTLADELGPAGIRVNSLLPGRFSTARIRELDRLRGDPDGVEAEISAAIPVRRYGSPEEFGRVAAFVLSPAASYLTGTTIAIDGGALRGL